MDAAVAAALPPAPMIINNWKRNVMYTVMILGAAALLLQGRSAWAPSNISSWIYNKLNTDIPIPFSEWSIRTSVKIIKTNHYVLNHINEFFDVYPIRTKLYSIGLLCSPRLCLLWAWLLDHTNTIALLHQYVLDSRQSMLDSLAMLSSWVLPDLPFSISTEAAELLGDNVMQWTASLNGPLGFWLAWMFAPGLQVSYYTAHFFMSAPIKVIYTVIIGLIRTMVEWVTMGKILAALLRNDRPLVGRSIMCCYVLPTIITCQTLTVLLWMCVMMPSWLVHISMVAICLWGPPMILALMTTPWQPNQMNGFDLGVDAPAGDAAAGLQQGVNFGARMKDWMSKPALEVHWPPPVSIPDEVQDVDDPPRAFICPITHSIMSEPAVTATGASYERSAITEWLGTHNHDPLTGRELRVEQLSPNLNLYSAIEEWVAGRAAELAGQVELLG